MPDNDTTDWNAVDSDWIAENRPDKLNQDHLDRLILKHGEARGREKFQSALDGMLRRTRFLPPYRSIK